MSPEPDLKGFTRRLSQLKMLTRPGNITIITVFVYLFPCAVNPLLYSKVLCTGMVVIEKFIVKIQVNFSTTVCIGPESLAGK